MSVSIVFCYFSFPEFSYQKLFNLRKPVFQSEFSSTLGSEESLGTRRIYQNISSLTQQPERKKNSIDYSKWDKILAPPIEDIGKREWQELLNLTAELQAEGDYDALESLLARYNVRNFDPRSFA